MCSVYVNADPIQYEARTRSIRINNVLTTIRLENLFWDVLAEIASREDKTTNQMIAALHEELFVKRDDSPNFTSFLRVCCLRYLSLPRLDEAANKQAALRTLLVPVTPDTPALPLHH
jgi:predicted DNA-binding ribbon-helix-helix protein